MSRYNRSFVFAFLLVALFSATLGFPSETKKIAACKLEVNPHLKGSFPIVSTEKGIISPKYNPTDSTWLIEIPANASQELNVLCLGKYNQIEYFATSYLAARCDDSGLIQTEYGAVTADQLKCSVRATATIKRNGKCFNNLHTKIEISFPGTSTPFIEICHDEVRSETHYTKHTINGPRLGEGVSINRPSFQEGEFYPYIDAESCYKTAEQLKTVAELLGSSSLADQYIQPSKNLFFSRGHLTPNGDGIPADEKRATFYFVNANPQWQTINGGNWNQLEIKTRDYAQKKNALLTVWTGGWGVTTLKDVNGNDKSIYLGKNSTGLHDVLPVPRILYKVIVNEEAKTGVVVIQIHNPYVENHKPEDIICTDICKQIPWVSWNVGSAQNGYTYCCDVSSFSKVIPDVLPDLGTLGLLV